MEGSAFDRLARAVSRAGSRRRLLGLVTSVGLGGLLSQLDDASTEAKRKRHGRKRSHRPGKHKDNRKGKRKKKGGGQCGDTGSDCSQNSDCCSNNCFDFSCAAKVHTCGTGDTAKQCVPPANGCAGGACCYGMAACGDSCCEAPANQCNPQGECCVPNCAGRQCGPDGCGAGGACGSCPGGQTCSDDGQCVATCNPQNCPNGCCDVEGKCQLGITRDACGRNGELCEACPSGETCVDDGVCRNVAGTCTTNRATCGQGLHSPCNSNDFCSCDLTTDGTQVCRSTVFQCGVSCNSNADCESGRVCVPCAGCRPANRLCVAVCAD
jgi:hypothetical protein